MGRKRKDPASLETLDAPVKATATPITTIEDILNRKNAPVEQKRIAYELMSMVGGERGLARKIMSEYESTAPGSLARARFFEVLLKLVAAAEPKELSGDMDYVTEEDISRMLREHCSASGVQVGYPTHVCI